MATRKLYDEDAYLQEFDATVLEVTKIEATKLEATKVEAAKVDEDENGQSDNVIYDVILDQTAFFPEEGGQTPDRGNLRKAGLVPIEIEEELEDEMQGGIESWNVLDVQIDEDHVIHHFLDQPIEPGTKVHGQLDWTHRFNNMQQHTGEHIYSGIVHKHKGYANVGFHLSDSIVTMDYDGELTDEEVRQFEFEANQAIVANVPIQCYYPDEETKQKLEYRSKIEIDGPLRIVEIPGVDCCACCAPHVRTTAEVGILKVVDYQRYKGGIRLTILCGFRALRDYQEKLEIATMASRELSVPVDSLVDAIVKQKDDTAKLKVNLGEANTKVMEQELKNVDPKAENVALFSEDIPNLVMRNAVNTLMESHSGFCAVFNLSDDRYQFIVGSKEKDAREMCNLLREQFGAKGGGSSEMVQGSFEKKHPTMVDAIKALF